MINQKSIFTALFLLNLLQLNASQIHQKLHATTTTPAQSGIALVGERSESKTVPEYFKFKQGQTRTFETLPDDIKYVIGQYVGFNQRVSFTPFQYAISYRDGNAVQILVALKADWLDKKCEYEHEKVTPLYAAIQHYSFTRNNIQSDLQMDIKEQKKSLMIVNYLLRKKIGINKIGQYGQTPIYKAIHDRHVDITQKLITAQADLTVTDQWNRTPLDTARNAAMQPLNPRHRKKLYAICAILEQAGAPSSVTLKPMSSDEIMRKENTIVCRKHYGSHELPDFDKF